MLLNAQMEVESTFKPPLPTVLSALEIPLFPLILLLEFAIANPVTTMPPMLLKLQALRSASHVCPTFAQFVT